MSEGWLNHVESVPLLNEELLEIRHALNYLIGALHAQGYIGQSGSYKGLLDKLSGLHGRDYKIVPLDDAVREYAFWRGEW